MTGIHRYSYKAKLEREIVKWAMVRLKEWKKENPGGLSGTFKSKTGRKMIEACLALEKLRAKADK